MKNDSAFLWMAIFLLTGVWIGFKDSLMLSALSRGGDNFVFSQPQRPRSAPYPQQNWQNPQNNSAPYGQQPYADPNPQYQNANPGGYGYSQPPSGQYVNPQPTRKPCNRTRYQYQGL